MTGKKDTRQKRKTGGSSKTTELLKRVGKGRSPSSSAAKKKKPVAKKKKVMPPKITPETYNKLQAAYFEKQNIERAGREAGVTKKTARYYIEGPGKPEVGFVAIKQLWLDIQVEAQEKRQITLVRFHEEQTKELEEILGTSIAELKLIRAEVFRRVKRYKDSGGTEIEAGASMATALATYERAARLMERFLGAPDATLAHKGEDKYRNWSDEEIIAFMTTGRVPDHAR